MSERPQPDKEPVPAEPHDDVQSRIEFEQAMADVVPLSPDSRGRVRKVPSVSTRARHEPATRESGPPPDDFVAAGIDRREIRKLKRGDYDPQKELDLHGMTVEEARGQVKRFIENSRHARLRCVCIVHGQGQHSVGGVSALKAPVRECLMAISEVLAYAIAPRSAGGTGAVYVLLRR